MGNSNYPQGSKENPFALSAYRYMKEKNSWHAAWVIDESTNYQYFISKSHHMYYDEGKKHGSIDYPYQYEDYDDMTNMKIWTGGFVQFDEDGTPVIHYVESMIVLPSNSGSSSSSSSSTGCQGCSGGSSTSSSDSSEESKITIAAGSMFKSLIDSNYGLVINIRLTWTEGKYYSKTHSSDSHITVHLDSTDSFGNYKYSGGFQGTAVWLSPLVISCQVSCDVQLETPSGEGATSFFGCTFMRDGTSSI